MKYILLTNFKLYNPNSYIVTHDSLHLWKETLRIYAEWKGAYVSEIKWNQEILLTEVENTFPDKVHKELKESADSLYKSSENQGYIEVSRIIFSGILIIVLARTTGQ